MSHQHRWGMLESGKNFREQLDEKRAGADAGCFRQRWNCTITTFPLMAKSTISALHHRSRTLGMHRRRTGLATTQTRTDERLDGARSLDATAPMVNRVRYGQGNVSPLL